MSTGHHGRAQVDGDQNRAGSSSSAAPLAGTPASAQLHGSPLPVRSPFLLVSLGSSPWVQGQPQEEAGHVEDSSSCVTWGLACRPMQPCHDAAFLAGWPGPSWLLFFPAPSQGSRAEACLECSWPSP